MLMAFFLSKTMIVLTILGICYLEYAYVGLKPLLKVRKEDRDKYPEFNRHDIQKLMRRWVFYPMTPFVFFKFIIGYGSIAVMVIHTWFVGFFYSSEEV